MSLQIDFLGALHFVLGDINEPERIAKFSTMISSMHEFGFFCGCDKSEVLALFIATNEKLDAIKQGLVDKGNLKPEGEISH